MGRLADLSWYQIGRLDRNKAVAIIPIASIEQHSHYLPVNTDYYFVL